MKNINKKKILAISGSTRKDSTNHHLIKAIEELTKDIFEINIYEGLSTLPHFNPDNNNESVAKEVAIFRSLINDSDGVIVCTPEYAHGVPGTLKNAIDWTVSSNEFYQKPTMLITASTDGKFAHQSLLETLRVIETKNIDQLQLLIQFAKTKINNDEKITDKKTLEEILNLIGIFEKTIGETATQNK